MAGAERPRRLHEGAGHHRQRGAADHPGGPGRTDPNIQLGNNVRTFPSTLPNIRTSNLNLLDLGIAKDFDLSRGVNLQVRVDAINALNYTVLWNPNQDPRNSQFGLVNQDRNNPRDIQLGARLKF